MSNTLKSFKGKPSTNLLPYSNNFSSWAPSLVTATTDISTPSPLASVTTNVISDNSAFATGKQIVTSSTINVTPSSTYACTIYAKSKEYQFIEFQVVDAITPANFNRYPVINLLTGALSQASGTTLNSDIFISPLENGWFKITILAILGASTSSLKVSAGGRPVGSNGNYTGVIGSGIYVCASQLELGIFSSPYIPTAVSTASRSTSQAILDLVGINTIMASSLTYASDNTFSFNGTSDFISSPLSQQLLSTGFSASIIFYYTSVTTNDNLICWGTGAFNTGVAGTWEIRIRGNASTNVEFSPGLSIGGVGAPTRLSYNQGSSPLNGRIAVIDITMVANGVASIYENGILKASNDYTGVGVNTNTNTLLIGKATDTFFPGKIYAVKVYNRALSAAEVAQNFNAVRGRYGI
jgi:hypothetical protein